MIVNVLRYNHKALNWDKEVRQQISSRPCIVEPEKGEAIFSVAFYPSLDQVDVYMNKQIPEVVLCCNDKKDKA